MNAADLARTAYTRTSASIGSPRSLEYDTLAKITRRLAAAAEPAGDYPALVTALHDNRKFWSLIAASVADDDNALPEGLRAQLFWLAEFTRAESVKCLRGEGEVAALIDVNTAVMKGLDGDTEAAA